MRNIYTYIFSMMAMVATGSFHTTSALAQDAASTPATTSSVVKKIDWSKKAQDITNLEGKFFYIYDIERNQFISTGGQYGVQPISAASGMEFTLKKADEISTNYYDYYIKSNVQNGEEGTGDCVGVKPAFDNYDQITEGNDTYYVVYIDRGEKNEETNSEGNKIESPERVKWNYKPINGTKQYTFYSTWDNTPHYLAYYLSSDTKKQFYAEVTDETKATKFYLITKEDYNQAIEDNSTVTIDVSNLIKDGRFERMNKATGTFDQTYYKKDEFDGKFIDGCWQFRNANIYTPTNPSGTTEDEKGYKQLHGFFINDQRYINNTVLAYGTAWLGKENIDQELYQEIENIPIGYYRITCQGFYKGKNESEAYLFAKNSTYTITKEARLQKLTSADEEAFDKIKLDGYPAEAERDPYVENMFKAGMFLSDSNPYQDGTKYTNSVYVKIEDTNKNGTGNLILGLKKKGKGKNMESLGDAYVDNFQLFYCGNTEWYLNAANTNPEQKSWTDEAKKSSGISTDYANTGINKDTNEYPVRYNLRRKFDVKAWNTFIVPFDIPGDQVKTAFSGNDEKTQAKVSEFDKINEFSDHIQIIFKKVDLDKQGIKANKPYIIWVGKDAADVATKNENYSFEYGANVDVSVKGPIYHIDGVTPTTFNSEVTTTEDGMTFQGYYYKPASGAPADSYILANGTMYHLTNAYTGANFVGTCWYMQNTATDAAGNAKPITFSFEGDGTTTAINGITLNEGEANASKADGYIYNLSGQRVGGKDSFCSLKPGVYIMDGKKILKK